MQFETKSVPLDTIDASDHTYRVSSLVDPDWIDALAKSIERLGLLQTPLILENKSQRQIISGFRRIAACDLLGRKEIHCRMLGTETTTRMAVQLAVAENAWQRSLNLMEKARALALLEKYYKASKSIAGVAKFLRLGENPTMIDKLIRLSRLPVTIQQAVETEIVGLAMALSLGKLRAEEGRLLLDLFQTFHLGLNRQRELLELITEIAKKESISIGQVLEAEEIATIIGATDQDRPTRAVALRSYLKKRRYPELTKAETEFQQLERELAFGPRIKMNPPPYFEGQTFQLFLTFDSLEELSSHQEQLNKMRRHPRLKEFLDR